MSPIDKLELAVQELDDALRCYFERRHHSALVLAAAAEQLFAGYVIKHGGTPAWRQDRLTITKIANGLRSLDDGSEHEGTSEKDIGDLLNRAYNHSKHAGKSDLTVEHDPVFEAQAALDRAITNFDFLCGRVEYSLPDLPLAQQFRMESVQGVPLGEVDDPASGRSGT
jgi:hypothetical protein